MNGMMDTVKNLKDAGFFGPLDVQMAGLVSRMQPDADANLCLAAALASRAIGQGHVCVDLNSYAGKPWQDVLAENLRLRDAHADADPDDELSDAGLNDLGKMPAMDEWEKCLVPPIIGTGPETGGERTLLVKSGTKLYLRRYWDYERQVEQKLNSFNTDSGLQVDQKLIKKYFSGDGAQQNNEQETAAKNAVEKRLSVLCGGPGTGKTYTVSRVVAMLAEKCIEDQKPFNVRIVAPTGKAAVRMMESIRDAKAKLKVDKNILEAIPEEATTIHRLLGANYQSPYFKHDAQHPLTVDMVIMDEASMVDLPLMAKLLDALPATCRLMLVGDVDQLASVEPGRVYGDICHAAQDGGPLAGCMTRLMQSRRFPAESIIGQVSALIHDGKAHDAWTTIKDSKYSSLTVRDCADLAQGETFSTMVKDKLKKFLNAKKPKEALQAANNFRVLCALRHGPYGVKRVNRQVERILFDKTFKSGGRFYDHQLVMINVNTPALNLYNGDVGVVLAGDEAGNETKELYAWFKDIETQHVKCVPVNLLPDHETAFAMTVHKAQGSEFPYVALILPEDATSPILTRELLYTGLTRVRINADSGNLTLWCSETSFEKAVSTKTQRTSGLFATTQEGVP